MFSVVSLFVGFFLLAILWFVFFNKWYLKLFSAFFLFSLVYVVSYYFVPAYADVYDYSRYGINFDTQAQYLTLLYTTILYFFIFITYFSLARKVPHLSFVPIEKIYDFRFKLFGLVCFLLCSISLAEISSIVATIGINVFLANRIVLTSGMGYFQLLLYFPLFWVTAFSIEKFFVIKKIRWYSFICGAILVILSSIPLVVLGSRSNLLLGLIIYSVSVLSVLLKQGMVKGFRKKIVKSLFGAMLIVFLGASLGEVRQELMAESEEGYVQTSKTMPLESVVKGFSSYENLYWFFSEGNSTEYQNGRTFLSVLVGPFPRSLWLSKPTGGGPIMKNHIAPGSYDLIYGDKISSYTTGFPTEAYLNFGWLGIIFCPVIMVSIIFFHERFMFKANSSVEVVVASALLIRILGFVNAEFYGSFIHIFVILVFYFFYKITRIRLR